MRRIDARQRPLGEWHDFIMGYAIKHRKVGVVIDYRMIEFEPNVFETIMIRNYANHPFIFPSLLIFIK